MSAWPNSAWIDVTRPMDETLVLWPGRAQPALRWEKTIDSGAHCNVSGWELNAHSGTHMDAPLHFIAGGKSIDELPPETYLGPCRIADLESLPGGVFDEAVAESLAGCERLLVRSAHSRPSSDGTYPDHSGLMTPEAAKLLVAAGLKLIGTDRLTVDGLRGGDFTLHHIFLGAGCAIIECLALAEVELGEYLLHAAPLRFCGAEASPIRALLRRI